MKSKKGRAAMARSKAISYRLCRHGKYLKQPELEKLIAEKAACDSTWKSELVKDRPA